MTFPLNTQTLVECSSLFSLFFFKPLYVLYPPLLASPLVGETIGLLAIPSAVYIHLILFQSIFLYLFYIKSRARLPRLSHALRRHYSGFCSSRPSELKPQVLLVPVEKTLLVERSYMNYRYLQMCYYCPETHESPRPPIARLRSFKRSGVLGPYCPIIRSTIPDEDSLIWKAPSRGEREDNRLGCCCVSQYRSIMVLLTTRTGGCQPTSSCCCFFTPSDQYQRLIVIIFGEK